MTTTHPAQTIEALLSQVGLSTKRISVGSMGSGSLAFVGKATAEKAAFLLAHAFKVRGPIKSYEDAQENLGTCLQPTQVVVWLVGIYPKHAA